jgi:hypothetical protein
MKKMPIKAAKDIAEKYGQDVVIMVTWEKETGTTHTVSYGRTIADCNFAASGANMVRKALGFPPELSNEVPSRLKKR